MSSNRSRCSYFFITINPGAECYQKFEENLAEYVNRYDYVEYSYIYHNVLEIDDADKSGHIHLVLYFRGSVRSKDTIKSIFKGAHVDLTNKNRYKRCIQYLIHKNDKNKYQYSPKDIHTNISQVDLYDIINSTGYDFEIFEATMLEDYMNDCLNSSLPNMYYFINRFGIDAIKPYYFIIKDLLQYEKDMQDELKTNVAEFVD